MDISKYPTLSSLAFAIFRTKFMEKEIIPKLSGKIGQLSYFKFYTLFLLKF